MTACSRIEYLLRTSDRKKESPRGEATTTSDYFASNGKSKPARSTPIRSRLSAEQKPRKPTAPATPESATPVSTPLTNGQKHSPTDATASFAQSQEDRDLEIDHNTEALRRYRDSGNDVVGAVHKSSRRAVNEEHQSTEQSNGDIQALRKKIRRGKQSSSVKENDQSSQDDGLDIEGADPRDTSVKYRNLGRINAIKPSNGDITLRGRKRKSTELDDDDENEEDDSEPPSKKEIGKKAKSPVKQPATKKARAPSKKISVDERTEAQDILDSIPTIRAPTPPPPDANKKFDFRSTAQRSQAGPASESEDVPIGAENCLAGLTFVFTGLLDDLGRDQGMELVKRYGGKVTTTPSSKTAFVILGNDAGPKKLETIAKHNLKTINKDGLYQLIRLLPANGGDGKAAEKFEEQKKKEAKKAKDLAADMEKEEKNAIGTGIARKPGNLGGSTAKKGSEKDPSSIDSRLWTVKYAPTAIGSMCGNKGQVEKLQVWLRMFQSNAKTKFKKGGKDGHGVYRAVMIHGPPGIGKTTAAHLVARLEGYDIVESNASDTRSKKLVETGLKGVLDTTSLLGYFAGDGQKVERDKKKLVLIMDEVDGMSAGDRGGVGALAAVCKKTNIPMILICNDRKLPKMKPFDHVTYDLSFKKPTTDQVRGRIMTICYREGLKISPNVINALIEGSRADIRQIINMISTAKLDQEAMDFDQSKKMSQAWEKHVILKPWDIVSKILGGGMFAPSSTSTLNDKIELYFNDHEFSSLMLQENYLNTNPIISNAYSGQEKKLKLLELVDKAAESISDGDLVDRMIHGSQQQWSLMPAHAIFSFVRPASFISGSQGGHGPTRFTSWLGNNSKQGMRHTAFLLRSESFANHLTAKLMRFVKEIQAHMRLRASGDRHEIRQQYMPLLWFRLVKELETRGKDSVEDVIELMDSYFLTKEDWDAIFELGLGPMNMDNVKLSTQTKATFTRLYNQQSHPLPFMKASNVLAPKKSRKEKPDLEEAIDDSDEGEDPTVDAELDDEEEALDLKKDKYVKAPKKRAGTKKASIRKAPPKRKSNGTVEERIEDEFDNEESEEDVEPRSGKRAETVKSKS